MERRVILRTPHGSRLYGLAHEGSDRDYYTVLAGRMKPKQTIDAGDDNLVIGFSEFMRQVERGVPQACEALFSNQKFVHPEYKPFLSGYRVTSPEAFDRYERTIISFALGGTHKKRRHSVRLAYNLRDLRSFGRFDPTMTEFEKSEAEKWAASGKVVPELHWEIVYG